MFKILDLVGRELQGCTQFDYKGYLVSMSTVFKPHEIAIFDKNDVPIITTYSVQEAIESIDNLISPN